MNYTFRKTLFVSLSLLMSFSATQAQSESKQQDAAGYQLVWQDNFDGLVLDETNNWNIEVNGDGGGNSELQYYRRENISIGKEPVSGVGCLIITGKKESYLGKTCTSGRLTTQNKMSFRYGKLEARIKLPSTANGLWPAFWLLGYDIATVSWPKCGEIDVIEMGSRTGINAGTQNRYYSGACHWGYFVNGSYPNYAIATTGTYSLQDDFHLYTLIWDNQYIRMYIDLDKYPSAAPYYEMGVTANTTDRDVYYYFNKRFFVIFNLAIGGNFPQIWDINQITALNGGDAKMYVDYVRVYQKGDTGQEYSGPKLNTGVLNPLVDNLFVFPTRITENVNVSTTARVEVNICTVTGRVLITRTVDGFESISMSQFPPGVYLLKTTDKCIKLLK